MAEHVILNNGIGFQITAPATSNVYLPGSMGGGVNSYGLYLYLYYSGSGAYLDDALPVTVSFAFDSDPTKYTTWTGTVGQIRAAGSFFFPNNYAGEGAYAFLSALAPTYYLTVNVTGSGTTTPEATIPIYNGFNYTLSATPASGGALETFTLNGSTIANPYLFTAGEADATLDVVFETDGEYELTVITTGTGSGTTNPANGYRFDEGDTIVFTATPAGGSLWNGRFRLNGINIPNPFTLVMPAGDATLEVGYDIDEGQKRKFSVTLGITNTFVGCGPDGQIITTWNGEPVSPINHPDNWIVINVDSVTFSWGGYIDTWLSPSAWNTLAQRTYTDVLNEDEPYLFWARATDLRIRITSFLIDIGDGNGFVEKVTSDVSTGHIEPVPEVGEQLKNNVIAYATFQSDMACQLGWHDPGEDDDDDDDDGGGGEDDDDEDGPHPPPPGTPVTCYYLVSVIPTTCAPDGQYGGSGTWDPPITHGGTLTVARTGEPDVVVTRTDAGDESGTIESVPSDATLTITATSSEARVRVSALVINGTNVLTGNKLTTFTTTTEVGWGTTIVCVFSSDVECVGEEEPETPYQPAATWDNPPVRFSVLPAFWDRMSPTEPGKLTIRFRDDNREWGNEHVVDLGGLGDTRWPRVLPTRGDYRTRQVEIVMTDRMDLVVNVLEEEVDVLDE